MTDVWTVLRKELRECFAERGAVRGLLIQLLVVVAVVGVAVPVSQPKLFIDVGATALAYLVFPPLLAASVAADAFAGERERKTLESLLTTPLSDRAVFLGKAASAITIAAGAAIVALAVAVVSHRAFGAATASPTLVLMLGLVGASLASSTLTSALAVAISVRIRIARSAQQLASLLAMAVGGAAASALGRLGLLADADALLAGDLALFGVGALALTMTQTMFRRELLFERH